MIFIGKESEYKSKMFFWTYQQLNMKMLISFKEFFSVSDCTYVYNMGKLRSCFEKNGRGNITAGVLILLRPLIYSSQVYPLPSVRRSDWRLFCYTHVPGKSI